MWKKSSRGPHPGSEAHVVGYTHKQSQVETMLNSAHTHWELSMKILLTQEQTLEVKTHMERGNDER